MRLFFKCYFLWGPHTTEQMHFMRVFLSRTHFTTELTEAMWIKCLAQGHSILMKPGFEPLITVSRNRHLIDLTNMLLNISYS